MVGSRLRLRLRLGKKLGSINVTRIKPIKTEPTVDCLRGVNGTDYLVLFFPIILGKCRRGTSNVDGNFSTANVLAEVIGPSNLHMKLLGVSILFAPKLHAYPG